MWMYPALIAGGLGFAGLTTNAGGGLWFSIEVRDVKTETFSMALEGRYLFPTLALEEPSKKPFHLTGGTVGTAVCLRGHLALGSILACAVGDVGVLVAQDAPKRVTHPELPTFGAGPRLAFQIPLSEAYLIGLRVFGDVRFSPILPLATDDTGRETWDYQRSLVVGFFGAAATFN